MRAMRLAAATLMVTWSLQAWAGSVDDVCKAIVKQANHDGTTVGEKDIYDLSKALPALLPKPMRYLTPRSVKSADVSDLLGCAGANCPDGIEDLLAQAGDPIWDNVMVDTRPLSRQVFIYTEHTALDHDDSLVAVERSADGQWKRTFESGDASEGSGFKILIDGKRPYVIIPPGNAFIGDDGDVNLRGSDELELTVEDPSDAPAQCSVLYHLTSRLTVSDKLSRRNQIVPSGQIRGAIVRFLDRNLQAMARQTDFAGSRGVRILAKHAFVGPGTSASELSAVDRLLDSQSQAGARDAAMRNVVRDVMSEDWDQIEDRIEPEDWEARWFSAGLNGHAYAGLLLRFSKTFPTVGAHFFHEALVALFIVKDNGLQTIAAYELQNVSRFSSAEIDKAQ